MRKELLIASSPHETKVAVLEDDQLVEVYFQRESDVGLVGGIYKGRVNRVLPGMQSAFVDIGLERDAFLYVSDFFEDAEEYDRVFTEAENRVARASGVTAGEAAPVAAPEPVALEPKTSEGWESPDIAPSAVPPVSVEEVAVAPPAPLRENTEPAAEAGAPATTPPAYKTRDFPGRRHRRRGHRFRDLKHGNRREAEERPNYAQPQERTQPAIELLPGESLAKYTYAAAEEISGSEPRASEPGSFSAAEHTVDTATSPSGSEPAAALRPFHENPFDENPGQATHAIEEAPSSVPSTPQEVGRGEPELQGDPLAHSAAETPGETEAGYPKADWISERGGNIFASGAREGGASVPEVDEAREGSAMPPDAEKDSHAADLGGLESHAVNGGKDSPPSTQNAGPNSGGQSYTLREPSRRPHVAPRRPRRGRGRFRGRQQQGDEARSSYRAENSRSGNNQPLPINELLKQGQEILVQIAKEPLGAKGARITSHIALPGRYLVYMPTIDHIGVSRKIGSEEERLRLRKIILENKGALVGGFIVRTAGAGRSVEEFKADLTFLTNLWNDIRAKADRVKAPALLHRDLTLVERILRDLLSPEFKSVRVDNEVEYEQILDFINQFQPSLIGHVKLYTRDAPLFEEFGVQAEIDKALKPKVWLKSGGYIVINQTEALVAIDVNTGKYVGKTNRLEDTIVRTNIDAVKEIVRQIRLRDLGGIIVIDFIDMDERRNRAKVVQALEDALRDDRAPTKILSFNEFGLVALTRKRVKHSLERTLCEPCPYCTGAGWIKSVSTVSNDILAEARKMASQIEGDILHLRVNPQVAVRLKAKEGVLISEIESATRKEVVIKSDASAHQEQFEIY